MAVTNLEKSFYALLTTESGITLTTESNTDLATETALTGAVFTNMTKHPLS